MTRRSVKKTTNEQFDLLKAEMTVHHAAARGYGVGANRAIVDAEWKDIVEKLNEIGPPHRTMTEWKKVWSDVRLRMRKRFSEELMNDGKKLKPLKKIKKEKFESEEDQLLDSLNNSTSIYVSDNNKRTETNDEEHSITPNLHEEDSNHEDYYQINPLDEAEQHSEHDNSKSNLNSGFRSPHNTVQSNYNEDKLDFMEQTMYTLQNQIENQNKLMENLSQITSNMASIMERHVAALERNTNIMERQLNISEYNNIFLRRQEARRKVQAESSVLTLNNS